MPQGMKSAESSRRNSLSAEPALSSRDEAPPDLQRLVSETVQSSLATALGPLMERLAVQPGLSSTPPPQASSARAGRSQHGDQGDMMQQLMDMVSARFDQLDVKHSQTVRRAPRPASSAQRFYSEREDDEGGLEMMEDADGRLAPYALSVLDVEASAVAWVRAQTVWDARSLKEAYQWANLIDAFRAENLPLESISLEIAVRRLIGLHLSVKHSNWELAEVLMWDGDRSLLSRGQLSRVIKEANSRAALKKRASGAKKSNKSNQDYKNNKNKGGHGGHGAGPGGKGSVAQ